jgi:hypothetical protein
MKIPRVRRISTTVRMKNHALYPDAKAGNLDAACKLVADVVPDTAAFANLHGYVCPVNKFKGNKIPLALALHMSGNSYLVTDDGIYLDHQPHGSAMCERIYYQPGFSGPVKRANYIIVDDVYTSGKTLKALKNYIEKQGGNVIGAWCIGAGASLEFEPDRIMLKLLYSKFPDIERYIDVASLTMPQVQYLLRLTSLNRLWRIHADNQLQMLFA